MLNPSEASVNGLWRDEFIEDEENLSMVIDKSNSLILIAQLYLISKNIDPAGSGR
jgi:hypothetical protein